MTTKAELLQAISDFYGEPLQDDRDLYDALVGMEKEGVVILWGDIPEELLRKDNSHN